MTQHRALYRFAVPLGLTALLLCARLVSAPALSDPVSGSAPASLYLHVPWPYLVLAPLFTLWDGVSMLSMTRLVGFLTGLALLYPLWRIARMFLLRGARSGSPARVSVWGETKALAMALGLFSAFVIVGALWHRPMLSLAGTPPEEMVVDFHGHTNVSHDVRDTWMRGFDAEANRRWHTRAGFDVAFITDHNVTSHQGPVASRQSPVASRQLSAGSTVLCPGIEISAWRAHIILLGDTGPIDRRPYNESFEGLLRLLATSDSSYNALSVASLPEYRRNHWNRLEQLTAAGLDGFEIVNASPKANELTRAEVNSVISLARTRNKFVVGVSDSHGWGATSMVWNLVRSPGKPPDTCAAVLQQLRTGFPAVRVLERHRLRPDDWWPVWLTPAGVIWETWRSMGWALTVAWLVWIWAWALRPRRSRSG